MVPSTEVSLAANRERKTVGMAIADSNAITAVMKISSSRVNPSLRDAFESAT